MGEVTHGASSATVAIGLPEHVLLGELHHVLRRWTPGAVQRQATSLQHSLVAKLDRRGMVAFARAASEVHDHCVPLFHPSRVRCSAWGIQPGQRPFSASSIRARYCASTSASGWYLSRNGVSTAPSPPTWTSSSETKSPASVCQTYRYASRLDGSNDVRCGSATGFPYFAVRSFTSRTAMLLPLSSDIRALGPPAGGFTSEGMMRTAFRPCAPNSNAIAPQTG